ncbi:redoxin domain-containing protein [uncultured Abyssibacter sp.]|uniref:redoxin domain-containing protein n=1 Tax=uncultured Abyssibacter sp. TaxID=2320202 RepID=UPI0032B2078E
MRHLFAPLVLLALCLGTAQAKVAPGNPAPDFTLPSASGETVSLSDYSGKTVILEWTNHGCPFVQKHYDSGNMQSLQTRYTGDDVVWLSIISSAPGKQGHVTPEKAMALTTAREATPTHVLLDEDGTVGRMYGAKTTPHMYVIDTEGTMLAYMGAIDSIPSANPADIEQAMNYVDTSMTALAQGDLPDPASTRPYGCSVKY